MGAGPAAVKADGGRCVLGLESSKQGTLTCFQKTGERPLLPVSRQSAMGRIVVSLMTVMVTDELIDCT